MTDAFWLREYRRKAAGTDLAATGRGDHFSAASYLRVLAHVLKTLKPEPRHSIIDVGCGNGLMLPVLAAQSRRVVGIEPVRELAAQARRHSKGYPVSVYTGASTRLQASSRSFDRLLCYSVIQLLRDQGAVDATLSELARVLKTGGRGLVGAIPDARRRDAFLIPYLEGVRRARHLSSEKKDEIVERNLRCLWQNPLDLVARAGRVGLRARWRRAPAALDEGKERFEMIVEKK